MGKKLAAVKRQLKRNRCKLGKVTLRGGAGKSTGKVKQQSPKPRSVRPPGAKVKVTLR